MYLSPLILALTYTWAQENIGQQVTFYFFRVKAQFLPMLMLGVSLLMGGFQGFLQDGSGYLAAYLFFYFDTIYPRTRGTRILTTPQFLKNLVPSAPPQRGSTGGVHTTFRPRDQQQTSSSSGFSSSFSSRFQGKGHRLGSS
jgi:hypothetical protein